MPESQLYIIDFQDVDEAVDFAKETFPDSMAYKTMLEENEDGEAWVCVIGVCDICERESVFFAPACIYDEEIIPVECSDCGNKSVYPMEMKEGDYE